MKIVVTGATGFVGRHGVAALLAAGHSVVAVARTQSKARELPWYSQVKFIEADLHRDFAPVLAEQPDVLVHLAWPGLPNYKDAFHLEINLPADLAFLEAATAAGVRRLVVAGTCLEYGLLEGPLTDTTPTHPITPYGQAKDTLRKRLEERAAVEGFSLQWVRLFYMYGEGQNPNSLLSQLDLAIAEGREAFNMSHGEQLRDYLTIEQVAALFAKVVDTPAVRGVINCCSGQPVSVVDFVRRRCAERGSAIRLNRGHYPVPDYEPLAFWGVPTALEPTLEEVSVVQERFLESLRHAGREALEATRQRARVAELEHQAALQGAHIDVQQRELAHLRGIVAQEGHQFVMRMDALFARHPWILTLLRPPLRVARWLLRRLVP